MPLRAAGDVVRSHHTATLLTDGRVLISGGRVREGEPQRDAEIWSVNGATVSATPVNGQLPREGIARATLLADGRVLLEGSSVNGQTQAMVFDPVTGALTADTGRSPDSGVTGLAEAQPADGARNVLETVRLVLRFTNPVDVNSVTKETVTLWSGDGPVDVTLVAAESGRLVFVTPRLPLAFAASYELKLNGLSDTNGQVVVAHPIRFTTREEPVADGDVIDSEAWLPDPSLGKAGWRTDRPESPWATLPPLTAPDGVTALAGQALRLDGHPLPNVTLAIEGRSTKTDRTGRFLLLLEGLPSGRRELLIDGRSARRGSRTYGVFEYGLNITGGRTTVLPFTIWMPRIDTQHKAIIASPTATETVITTPTIPGLELHLPAGATIRDHEGQAVREVSITPIPVDRPPFPLPRNVDVPVYFTIQPGGGYIYTRGYGQRGGWLLYPNYRHERAEKKIQFFHYDPEERDWYVYGLGTVTRDQKQVVPDATTRIYELTGAMLNSGDVPPADGPPSGDCCGNDGDPVNLTTGLFTLDQTDVTIPDVLPITLTRTYRTRDLDSRPFGVGTTHPYAMFLWSAQQYQEADLILPDGGRIHYVRVSDGTGFTNAVFEHKETAATSATPTMFYKSLMQWNGNGWDVRLKDGTTFVFGENAPLQAIRDRHGNTITVQHANGQSGNITRVISPHGRWLEFSYDPSDRVTQVKDNIGRTWTYTYDGAGDLWKVTDPLNQVTEYTYDADQNMRTIKNRNGIVYVTNEYTTVADAPTPVGWVKKQTHADGGVYEFSYTVANGRSTRTDVKDPRGYIRHLTFNTSGYTTEDTHGLGTADQQRMSTDRPNNSNFPASMTDNAGHVTAYGRDSLGNEKSTTWLSGTPNARTANYDWHPVVNSLASVTDSLLHTTSLQYDPIGNIVGVTDAMSHQTTIGYNGTGQVTSVKNALNHETTISYQNGDVRSVTDPLGRTRTIFVDAVGRVMSVTSPTGQQTRYEYDPLNRIRTITDALGNNTLLEYTPEGELKKVTDARLNITEYRYTQMGQLESKTDSLARSEQYEYDKNGNLVKATDRRGIATTYEYDTLNRLRKVSFASGSFITLTYNLMGHLWQLADSSGATITYTYDDMGRLTSEATPLNTIAYSYDAADRLETMTVGTEPPITYSYDAANRLTGITRGSLTTTIGYDDANRRVSLLLPNGITTTYGYNDAAELTSLTSSLAGQPLIAAEYAYDSEGNRISGSGLGSVLPQGVSGAVYDAANQLLEWGPGQYSYDASGNRTSDGLTSYVWNDRNQLVALEGSVNASFAYDALGRRASKTLSGSTLSFLYDGANVAAEYSGGAISAFVVSNRATDEYLARLAGGATQIPLVDGIGSVVSLTDSAGGNLGRFLYEPYGHGKTAPAQGFSYGFTGREQDSPGLMYYRARYYDPSVGRFISQDPIGLAGGANLYAYASGNPLRYTDPTGTSAQGAVTILDALLGWLSGTLPTPGDERFAE